MIKKIFAATIVSFALVAGSFAGNTNLAFNVGLSLPQIYNLHPNGEVELTSGTWQEVINEKYSSIGVNLGLRISLPLLPVGFFLDGNIYSPLNFKQETKDAYVTYDLNDDNKFWGIDGTLGAYISLIDTDFISIPLGAGLHMGYTSNAERFSVGLGSFANAEFSLGGLKFYGGIRLNWDFYSSSTPKQQTYKSGNKTVTFKKKSTDSKKTSIFYAVPVVGAVFSF